MQSLQQHDWETIQDWEVDYLIGVDESGRGPLAGPVVASAVVMTPEILQSDIWEKSPWKFVNDSKKVTKKRRENIVSEKISLISAISSISHRHIDEMNILEATKLAWRNVIEECLVAIPIDASVGILIDGNILLSEDIGYRMQGIVRGDSYHLCISLASIYAKVYRDRWMQDQAKLYPEYGFERHNGYGTKHHFQAIQSYGLSPIHRISFCSQFVSSL